jgi:hypothetical protein
LHDRDNFITEADERVLLDAIADIAFSDFEMRGIVARRRVAFFGQSYDRMTAGPLPTFLLPLRARVVQWAGVDTDVCDGAHQRVLARLAHRLASRRSAVRHRRQHLVAVGMPNEVPSVPFSSGKRAAVGSSLGDARSCARAPFGVSHDARVAYGVEHHIPPVAELR